MDALLTGEPLRGTWYDRTKEWAARQRGEEREYPEAVEVHFSPLPCWAHLPATEVRNRVADMVAGIEEEAEAIHGTFSGRELPTRLAVQV